MRYDQAKEKIRNGDLLSFHGTGLVARLIQWATGSEICHVGLAVWLHLPGVEPKLCVMESTGGGVRLATLSVALDRSRDEGSQVYWQRLLSGGPDRDALVARAVSLWGKKYPPMHQLLISGFDWPRRIYARLFGTPDVSVDAYHCAEMVATALELCGVNLGKSPVLMTPEDVSLLDVWGARTLLEVDE